MKNINEIFQETKDTIKNTPIITKILFWGSCILYFINLITGITDGFYNNCNQAFLQFHIWRIFTFPFCHFTLAQFLLNMLMFLQFSINKEKQLGTIRYFFDFIMINAFLAMLFNFQCLLVGQIFDQAFRFRQYGIFPYYILYQTEILWNENNSQFLFFKFEVKNKHQPLLLSVLLWIFIGFQIDYINSILFGIIGCQFLKSDNMITDKFIQEIEENQKFSFIKNDSSFISRNDTQDVESQKANIGLIQELRNDEEENNFKQNDMILN